MRSVVRCSRRAERVSSHGSLSSSEIRKSSEGSEMLRRPKSVRVTSTECPRSGWRRGASGTDWLKEFLETAPYLICRLPDRFRPCRDSRRRSENQALLCAGVCRYRRRVFTGGPSYERPGDADSYAERHGISFKHSQAAEERASVPSVPVGLPSRDATVPAIANKAIAEVMEIL